HQYARHPRDLWVKPDGYRTIAKAIRAARPGDSVKVPAGVYHEALALRSGVNVYSDGDGQAILMPEQFPAVVADRVKDLGVHGFVIATREGQKFAGPAILISDADVRISHCQVGGDTRIGIELRGASKSAVEASTISGHDTGVFLRDNASPRLQGNWITKNRI